MATTEEYKNGGSASYSFSIEKIKDEDIKVSVDGTDLTYTATNPPAQTTEYTVNGSNVILKQASVSGSTNGGVRIYRETALENADSATFVAGSSIRAADLNANHKLIRFSAQEKNQKIVTDDIKDSQITSAKILDGTIVDADINASAAIAQSKLATGTLPSGVQINSSNIVNGSIVNDDVNVSANIAGTKVNPTFGSQNVSTSGTLASGAQTVTGNIAVSGTVDGRDVAADGTKLDTIETGATADQTNAEIRAAVEAATDSNVFTDADHSKLNAIEAGATADQTNAEIKTAYEANADTNEFSDAEQSKLAGIETAATADQTAGEIKTLLQSDKLTLSEMNTTSLDSRYYTETEAEAKFLRQDSSETIASGQTWSNSDAFVATTAAINARIIDLIDEVGGFTAIANQTSFPATNPQGATGQSAILSIAATTATLTPSGTTITIPNGAGTGNTVTITGAPTIPQNFGFLVESTATTHTYSFHRLVPIATQVNTVASNITNIVNAGANVADINNFADIYIISASEPTQRNDGSSLQEGDLWFDSSNDNLQVYTGSAFSIITPSQSVLDDVAIVSGAITYAEDLGLITDPASTGSSNGSLDIVADALEDERTFIVTAGHSPHKFLIDGVDKPALTLHKGWTYTFDVSDSSNGAHPFRFYAGSSQYSTNVTVTGTQGQAGAKVQIVIPESQPSNFQYYCTNHSGMGNSITVVEDPIKAVADIASSVVTVGGIASNVTTVANNTSNINAVQANESNINAVQANASNINAAVSNASNINAVVSNATNINTVAGNNSNITTVANNTSNINSAVSNQSNINAAVSNATNINTVSASIADVNRYANEYKISTSAPGSPSAGDLWFDESTNTLKNYNGAAWLGITSNSGIQNVADDTSPELAAALDCNNFNLTEVGTVSGNNLQIDFGTL